MSEGNSAYRDVITSNHGLEVNQVFSDVDDQISYHHEHGRDRPTVDVGVTGSPCNPFSTQRSKRFQDGDVASHKFFETTMVSIIRFYEVLEPRLGITEQVCGFDQPFTSGNSATPLQMLLGNLFCGLDIGCCHRSKDKPNTSKYSERKSFEYDNGHDI